MKYEFGVSCPAQRASSRDAVTHLMPRVGGTIAGIAAAVIAAASAAYSSAQAAKAKQRAKRSAANASQMSGTGQSVTTPTANRFGTEDQESGDRRIQDILKVSPDTMGGGASDQRLSLGLKPLDAGEPPAPQSFESAAHGNNAAMPIERIGEPAAAAPSSEAGAGVGDYASIANSLLSAYMASRPDPPQPGQRPQPGEMNLLPTASRFGVR